MAISGRDLCGGYLIAPGSDLRTSFGNWNVVFSQANGMKELTQMIPASTQDGQSLRDQVYADIRSALMMGHYVPGQKLIIRQLAEAFGTSLTPVRECLCQLVAEGVLEGEAKRSVRVPRMTGAKIRELRDIRLAVEGLAVVRAAERITSDEVARLRSIAGEIVAARDRGDIASDVSKQGEFQLSLYRMSEIPHLVRIIEGLWLQTGPYLRLLHPNYVRVVGPLRGDWRGRLCGALETRDIDVARYEIETNVAAALDYLVTIVDAADIIGSHGTVDRLGNEKVS